MNLFVGMTVQIGDDGPCGRIDGTFGKSKFKVMHVWVACQLARTLLGGRRALCVQAEETC